jgi:hypothetical protein
MRVLCLRHGDDGCFFIYFPGQSSKKRIQMIDDKQRPIEGVVWRPKPAISRDIFSDSAA